MGQNINNKKTTYDNLLHINPYCSYFDNFLYNCFAIKIGEIFYFAINLCIIYNFDKSFLQFCAEKQHTVICDRCQKCTQKNIEHL